MIGAQKYSMTNFTGGITDDFIDGAANEYEKADNLILTPEGKLAMVDGSQIYSSTEYETPAGRERIGNIFKLGNTVFVRVADKVYYLSSGCQLCQGPTGNQAIPGATTTTLLSITQNSNHLILSGDNFANPMKVFHNASGTPTLRNAGLPALASSPSGALTAGASTLSYLYRFVYEYTYTVGTVTYTDRGATKQVTVSGSSKAAIDAATPCSITGIPTLSNSTTDNYDTTTVNIEIYRTKNNGTVFYYVGEVDNGTTVFSDTVDDTELEGGELLYTEGGVVDNDKPLPCKYVHMVGTICYYANIKDGTEEINNRIFQSKPGDFDSVPATFYDDVEDEITGLSSFNGNPIVFCAGSIYRLDGKFDSLGRGSISHERISDTTGCVNHNSIVQTLTGVFFAGTDGFYWTNGYEVKKISEGLNTTYRTLVSSTTKKSRIIGAYEKEFRRVWWTVQKDAGSDNDSCMILDTRWGIRPKSTFTIANGTSYGPSAIYFDGSNLIRGHYRGYLFKHSSSLASNYKVDEALTPTSWVKETIRWKFRDCSRSFGSARTYKMVPRIQVLVKNQGNIAIQPNAYNDLSGAVRAMKPIRSLSAFIWGDSSFVWGNTACIWNDVKILTEERRTPANGLRALFFQLEIENANAILYNSDSYGTCVIDNTAKTATLSGTNLWPADCEDYNLYVSTAYDTAYEVNTRTSNTVLTLTTAPASGTYEWYLKGYGKDHKIYLIGTVIDFVPMSENIKPYDGTTGANV